MKRIVMVRHGATPCTLAGRFCGSHDPDLVPQSLEAAQLTGGHDALRGVERAVTSPARRARATAAALLGDAPASVDPRLREIDFGAWEDLTPADVRATPEHACWQEDPAGCAPPGGETGYEAQRRLVEGVDDHLAECDSLLVVSHKGAIRLLISHYCGLPARDFRRLPPVPACSISLVEIADGVGRCVLIGDVSRLPERLRLGAY